MKSARELVVKKLKRTVRDVTDRLKVETDKDARRMLERLRSEANRSLERLGES